MLHLHAVPMVISAMIILVACDGVGPDARYQPSDLSFGERYAGGARYWGYSPVLDAQGEHAFFGCPWPGTLGRICKISRSDRRVSKVVADDFYLGQPALSPDGRWLAFVSEAEGTLPSIYVFDFIAGVSTRITPSDSREHSPVVSPDGEWIAFVRHMSSNADDLWSEEVFVVRFDGTQERRVTNNTVRDSPVLFSSDGRALYLARDDSQTLGTNLYRLDLDSGNVDLVLELQVKGHGGIAVSPDEQYVAFIDDREEPFQFDVYLCEIDGTNLRRLTYFKGFVGSVSFAMGRSDLLVCEVEPKGGDPGSIADIVIIDWRLGLVERIPWLKEGK